MHSQLQTQNKSMGFNMDVLSFCYAATLAAGGIIGFVKAGSTISMCMGLGFGGLSAYGAYQTSHDEKNFGLLLGCSSVLLLVMGYRAYNSGKFMPSGLVAALSLLMVIRFSVRMIAS